MSRTITTIVLTYNHAPYIEQAVRSVQMQELPGWRHDIVVIDDASTDGTSERLLQLAAGDTRIRLVIQPANENSNRALASELDRCPSTYFAVLDGDDYWSSSGKLATQINYLEAHPKASLCFHDAVIEREDGRQWSSHEWLGSSAVADLYQILAGDFVPTCSAVARVQACTPLPAWYAKAPLGDWPLWVFAAQSGQLHHVSGVMAVRRVLPTGMWIGASPVRRLAWELELYELFASHFGRGPARTLVERCLWQRRLDLAVQLEAEGRFPESAKYFRQCMIRRPPGALEIYFARMGVTRRKGLQLIRRTLLFSSIPTLRRVFERHGRALESLGSALPMSSPNEEDAVELRVSNQSPWIPVGIAPSLLRVNDGESVNFLFSRAPRHGEWVGVEREVTAVPERHHTLCLAIRDSYPDARFPGRLEQQVILDGVIVWRHDLSGDEFNGWSRVHVQHRARGARVKVRVALVAVGPVEATWGWEHASETVVRNFTWD